MRVISKTPSKKLLTNGYQRFCFNWWRVLLFILLFPLSYFWSKKYVKDFLSFIQTYQRTGKISINDKLIDFNSFELYHQDLITKKLKKLNFSFSQEQENAMKTITILNRHQEEISVLYWQQSSSTKWVIGIHGWTENKYLGLRQVFAFVQQGYNVLTFDSFAHGLTARTTTGIGYYNAENLADIINWLSANFVIDEIGLIGNSMGAACLTKYLVDEGYQNNLVRWAISDCGFNNLLIEFRYVMQYRYQHPWWLISYQLNKKFKKEVGFNLRKYNLLKNLSRLKNFPILIFHGDSDDFVPLFMSKMFFNKKIATEIKKQSKLVIFPELNHVEAISKGHQTYISEIKIFIANLERK